jgi:hypothetical protein
MNDRGQEGSAQIWGQVLQKSIQWKDSQISFSPIKGRHKTLESPCQKVSKYIKEIGCPVQPLIRLNPIGHKARKKAIMDEIKRFSTYKAKKI